MLMSHEVETKRGKSSAFVHHQTFFPSTHMKASASWELRGKPGNTPEPSKANPPLCTFFYQRVEIARRITYFLAFDCKTRVLLDPGSDEGPHGMNERLLPHPFVTQFKRKLVCQRLQDSSRVNVNRLD